MLQSLMWTSFYIKYC